MFLQPEEEKKSEDIMNDWWYDRAQNVTTSTAAIHETIIFVQLHQQCNDVIYYNIQ